jgi:hypothetical protein
MRSESGNQYYKVLGPDEIGTSQSPYGGLNLEFYIKAWDSLGNFSQSSSGSLPLDYCVQ